MKHVLTYFILILLLLSCRKENQESAIRDLKLTGFTKLSIGGSFQINVIKGASFSVKTAGRIIDLEDINAVVRDGELFIEYKNALQKHETVTISVFMPSLAAFRFYNKCNAQVSGFSQAMELEGTVSQNSNAIVYMNVTQFTVDVLDNSELILNGSADKVIARADNQSIVHAYNVPSVFARAIAAKSSIIRIHASHTINASAIKNSFIYYKGNPGNLFLTELENSGIIAE